MHFCTFSLICTTLTYVFTFANGEEPDIVMVQAVFRHGDRSPVSTYPKDVHRENAWPQGFGQLSMKGMVQEYKLGQFFKQRYNIDNKLISSLYNKSEVHVRSTDRDRTLMSAYCVLNGMFPVINTSQEWIKNLNWQPIPVHTEPLNEDCLLNTDCPCPKYNKLFGKFMRGPIIKNLTDHYQDLIRNISKLSGLPPTIEGLFHILDPIFCEKQHNMSIPDWAEKIYDTVLHLMDLEASYNFYIPEIWKLRGGPLLGHMIKNMKAWIDNHSPSAGSDPTYKLYLYSAHDSTLNALMHAMQVYDGRKPKYSSSVIVELHKSKTNMYTVKVIYKNSTFSNFTKELKIAGCEDPCKFKTFTNLMKDMVPANLQKACNITVEPSPAVSKSVVSMIVLGCLVGLLAIALVAVVILYMKQRSSTFYRLLPTDEED